MSTTYAWGWVTDREVCIREVVLRTQSEKAVGFYIELLCAPNHVEWFPRGQVVHMPPSRETPGSLVVTRWIADQRDLVNRLNQQRASRGLPAQLRDSLELSDALDLGIFGSRPLTRVEPPAPAPVAPIVEWVKDLAAQGLAREVVGLNNEGRVETVLEEIHRMAQALEPREVAGELYERHIELELRRARVAELEKKKVSDLEAAEEVEEERVEARREVIRLREALGVANEERRVARTERDAARRRIAELEVAASERQTTAGVFADARVSRGGLRLGVENAEDDGERQLEEFVKVGERNYPRCRHVFLTSMSQCSLPDGHNKSTHGTRSPTIDDVPPSLRQAPEEDDVDPVEKRFKLLEVD